MRESTHYNRRLADSWEAWVKTQTNWKCKSCWIAEKNGQDAQQRDATNTEAAARSAEMGLPALIGTEKQIVWATTLRQKTADWLMQYAQSHKAANSKHYANITEAINLFFSENTACRYWIEYGEFGRDSKQIRADVNEAFDRVARANEP